MAKEPVAGRVKTRLTPPFTPEQGAALAQAALLDTLDAVLASPATRRVLCLDGAPGPWLPPGFEVLPQRGNGLDERLGAALADCAGPTFIVGMDTPQLKPHQLQVNWSTHEAWLGPAEDGGYWGIALRTPDPALILGVEMSTAHTGTAQLTRLHQAGLRTGLLAVLRDVDTAADAAAVAATCPQTRFARRHAAFVSSLAAADVR
ncbi:MAG: TIGR04282 family arsenosugar biosynthesis glycosyltransferase [Sporichthyaceae bacterium]